MFAALDVQYDDEKQQAVAAAVVFREWTDAAHAVEHFVVCHEIESYIPGLFYRRELPCLLAVIREIQQPLSAIVIDGYVNLGDKPGLGMHLWDALGRHTPIIGVAKTAFHAASACEIKRGASNSPLFITTIGFDLDEAANCIQQMAGQYRIPDLLRRVDQLARTAGRQTS